MRRSLSLLGTHFGADGFRTRHDLPRDINDTLVESSEFLEGSGSQIDSFTDLAASTLVYDFDSDRLLFVFVVVNLHTLVTVFKFLHGHSTNHAVNCSRVGWKTVTVVTSSIL